MHIGVPKEIKNHEYRVGLTPSSVREIVAHGHRVSVETGAGAGIGASDDAYRAAGAQVVADAATVFSAADMIVKVKEPQTPERALLREGQILFTYLHLAPDPEQCAELVKSKAVCIAYETVTQRGGGLPLLAPMSEVAGRMSIQAGAFCLERAHGGKGILLGGVLALLALGLNLIFGVIDVTWICYAELVMLGMYAMYFMVQYYGISYFIAAPFTILLVAALVFIGGVAVFFGVPRERQAQQSGA